MSQPDPNPRTANGHRKPLTRYSAIEGALASGLLPNSYTTTGDTTPELAAPPNPGTIEIDFANGARMRVTGAIDEATLAAALRALSDGRRSR